MKIIIAPDSYKESMSAKQAAIAMQKAIMRYDASIVSDLCPLADGGEGTLETLIDALNGEKVYYTVKGPLFEDVQAPIGYIDSLAIIECAQVCGLELLQESQKDPYQTTTYGLGELIKHALDHGASQMMICLGGSATNDGGIGMLSALGVRFLDVSRQEVTLTMNGLKDIVEIDETHLDARLQKVHFIGVCDVNNPLCGIRGATAIYGPQKGLLPKDILKVDQEMSNYANLCDRLHQRACKNSPGAGAAGGLGYALLAFLNAQLQRGFEVVSEVMHLEEKIAHCDCVFVGEGKMDGQTQYGKTPYGVLKLAQKYQKKVFGFAGRVEDQDVLENLGFASIYAISLMTMDLTTALQQGQLNLEKSVYEHMKEILHEVQR